MSRVTVDLTVPQAKALFDVAGRGFDEIQIETEDGERSTVDLAVADRAIQALVAVLRGEGVL